MKIIQLPEVLYEYLVRIVEGHAARGIHPEEGMAVNRLWDAVVNRVTTIPDAEIQKMTAAGSPEGHSAPPSDNTAPYDPHQTIVESMQTGKPVVVECKQCYEEEGSLACIRPSHQGRQTGPTQGT